METRELEASLKALADRRRLLILRLLAREERLHVGAIEEELRLSYGAASRNLRLLERACLVISEPPGVHAFYRIHPQLPPTLARY